LPIFDIVVRDYLTCTYPQERQKFILLNSLWGGSSVKLTYRCFCPQRGRYKIGPISVYFFDPLGLFYFKKEYPVYSLIKF
jgi:uncharacterized protein (DUF58 family)